MRQLWAKRAQMEKTSTSPVPYPKVFRAVKAEEMAQPGGGTGVHVGLLVASALNFEAALEALESTDPALHLFLHVYRGAFSSEVCAEMHKEAMSLQRSVI